jgi:hypothetical protein
MLRAWARPAAPGLCLALVFVIVVCTAVAVQQAPKAHLPPTPRLIILPPKLLAATQATLAVLDSQGRLLPNVEVELSGGQKVTTDATGRAIFSVAAAPGKLTAKAAGRGIIASASVETQGVPDSSAAPGGSPGGLKVTSYPHVLAIHDRFSVEGSGFRSAADSNHVYLNGDPCLVVASSPVSLVVLPGPSVPVGDVNLHVTVAGADAGQFPVSAVLLEFSGPSESVDAGTTGKLTVHAHGTAEPLLLEVRNGSPAVIKLEKGNVQRVKTSGGEDNSAPVEVKFLTGGNYAVFAKLISPDAVVASREHN